jgi:two-component system chemotaxis response regulator CheB
VVVEPESESMAGHDIIVIGASAGGVEALREITRGLPANLPATLFVVLHVPPQNPSHLPAILSRSGPLPAAHAGDGAEFVPGRIYVAPPDTHLLVESGRTHLSHGPTENRHRPAIDPLFRSAARAYGSRVVGVVLTGSLDDGTAGLYQIRRHGGVAVVQDPDDALFPSMPANALEYVGADYRCQVTEIAPLLERLARTPVRADTVDPAPDQLDDEYSADILLAAQDLR